MAGRRIVIPNYMPALDLNGGPVAGARLTFFENGTTTLKSIYTEADLATPHTNPVVADAAGVFPSIFADDGEAFSVAITDADGVPIAGLRNFDNIRPSIIYGSAAAESAADTVFTPLGAGAQQRTVQGKLGDVVSVLDFIPVSKHAGIRAGTNTDNLTSYFQAAVAAAASTAGLVALALGQVYVPVGRYHITKVGIQGAVLIGESREGSVLRAFNAGSASDFMLDGMLQRDGSTFTTVGTGWAENLSIEGTIPGNVSSGRSGLRTYGGGNTPSNLDIRNCAIGIACGLPIWQRVSNVFAQGCNVGFYTFHNSAGENGTSTTFQNCWALDSGTYGFHVTQLYYSQFIGCVSQEAGTHNFFVQGDGNGNSACYSLMFIGCATEGAGTPFYFKKIRQLSVDNPRIIQPDATVDFLTFDDCTGSIRDFTSAASPGGGKYHLNILNHTGGTGAISLLGDGFITTPASEVTSVSEFGPTVNGVRRVAVGGVLIGGYVSSPSALASNVDNLGVPVGAAVARLTPASGGTTITGIASGAAGGVDGQRLLIHNVSLTDNLTLVTGSASSASGNRLDLSGGTNIVIDERGSVELWYDAAIQRWHNVA